MNLRIGTRQSALAQTQTAGVVAQLKSANPALVVETILLTTTGDQMQAPASAELPLKGLFTKELDDALLADRIDIAVHSFKDIPPGPLGALRIAAVPVREDARDAWISKTGVSLAQIPAGARVATSSVRRRALLLRARPDLAIVPLRGNVDTRLRKLRDASFDALVLAYAGLKRLGFQAQATEILPLESFPPAAGQGALALVARAEDIKNQRAEFSVLSQLHHQPSYDAAVCEQSCLEVLAGSCHTPIAVYAASSGKTLTVRGLVLDPAGRESCEAEIVDRPYPVNPRLIGRELAEMLITRGAHRLLQL